MAPIDEYLFRYIFYRLSVILDTLKKKQLKSTFPEISTFQQHESQKYAGCTIFVQPM